MQNPNKHIIIIIAFGFLIPFQSVLPQNSGWRFKNRLQIGAEFDNNVRESRYKPVAGYSLKTMFHTKGARNTDKRRLMFELISGYQAYPEYAAENRLLTEAEGGIGYQLSRYIQIGANGRVKFKFYVNKQWDYASGTSNIWINANLPQAINARLTFGINGLDYASYNFYDFEGRESGLSISRQLTASLLMRIHFSYQNIHFLRDAFDYRNFNFRILSTGKSQQDKLSAASLFFQYYRKFLLTLSYQFRNNNSNSYGLSYQDHRVQFFYSQSLFWQILLRCNGTYQKKFYRDSFPPFISLELDSEREESSFLILDLSGNISANTAIFIRYAIYHNESPLRSFYYQKTLVMLGSEYRF